MNKKKYTADELEQLHAILYDILGELIRVCRQLNIPYFLQGGSAIGAFFEKQILPWDDDIDVGMKREDYERFLVEAPKILKKGYFIQWVGSEEHFPLILCKLRKDETMFVEEKFEHLDIHHGIYIDIMAYDRVPDNLWLQKIHRFIVHGLYGCIYCKEVWKWNRFRKVTIAEPIKGEYLRSTIIFLITSILSKKTLYKLFLSVSTLFNNTNTKYYNQVKEKRDQISADSLSNLESVEFGPLTAMIPSDVEIYLRHHYPGLSRYVSDDKKINHYPKVLSFKCPTPHS